MGTDIALYIEKQSNDRWINPIELSPVFPKDYPSSLIDIQICWWPLKWEQTGLFFGPHAVVQMHPGVPEDLCPELSRGVRPNFEDNATYAGWCFLDEMSLDLWETETVLLGNDVESRFAETFGTGERRASEVRQDLVKMGATEDEIRRIFWWDYQLVGHSQDWAMQHRYQLYTLPSDHLVPVTWRRTIADFAGPVIWCEGLARLRGLPTPHLYRIVTGIG